MAKLTFDTRVPHGLYPCSKCGSQNGEERLYYPSDSLFWVPAHSGTWPEESHQGGWYCENCISHIAGKKGERMDRYQARRLGTLAYLISNAAELLDPDSGIMVDDASDSLTNSIRLVQLMMDDIHAKR